MDSVYPRVDLELRGELAYPFNDLANIVGSTLGFGVGAALQYWETQSFGAYVGFDWYKWDASAGSNAVEFTDSGLRGGLRYQGRLARSGTQPFVYGGLINARSELHRINSLGRTETRYERGWGGELGVGVVVPILPMAGVVPEARIRFHGAEPINDPNAAHVDVRYWAFNLGVYWRIVD